MLLIPVKRSDLPRLLNHDGVSLNIRGDLVDERRGLLDDKDFDARSPLTLTLAGAYHTRQRHEAIGVVLQNLLNRLFRHRLPARTLSRFLPAARHRYAE